MTDPRYDIVLEAALSRVQLAVSNAIDKVSAQLGPLALSSTSNVQRQLLMTAERDLQLKASQLQNHFAQQLRELVDKTARGAHSGHQAFSNDTDWASLTLVDNAEVERSVTADRLGQTLTHECDGELEALQAYMAALNDDASPERNPLRPQAVAKTLLSALAQIGSEVEVIQALCQHLGRVLGPELGACYGHIVADMKSRGIKPQALSVNKTRSTSSVHGNTLATGTSSFNGDLSPQTGHSSYTQPGPFSDGTRTHASAGYPSHTAHCMPKPTCVRRKR